MPTIFCGEVVNIQAAMDVDTQPRKNQAVLSLLLCFSGLTVLLTKGDNTNLEVFWKKIRRYLCLG